MTTDALSPAAGVTVWRRNLSTLGAAAIGVAVAYTLDTPLPFLLGAVIGAAVGGLAFTADISHGGRSIGLTFLGLQIGAGFSPEAVDRLAHAPIALTGLVLSTVGAFAAGYIVYRGVGKWSRETGLLAAMPGALATVLALLEDKRADPTRVAIAQSVRLGALVVVLPLIIPSNTSGPPSESWTWAQTLPVLAVGASAGWALERLKVPAGALLGPALVTMIATLLGWVEGAPPEILFLVGLWIIGASTGARLSRGSAAAWRANALVSLLALALAMAAAWGAAFVFAPLSGFPLATLLLAFAPGGIDAMTALSIGLGLDPAFVAACHIARVIGITLLLPLIYRWWFAPTKP